MTSSSAEAVMAAEAADQSSMEGPVLSLITKRLRALRKKYNRIVQMEDRVAEGKTLNKEQEDVLRSKPAVSALIDEFEKLRSPLSSALNEELSRVSPPPQPDLDPSVEDLVGLLYFGCLFDVKPQGDFTAMMLTRAHERGCCLTYDYVTDESTELLGERDLDAISVLGGLLTSRPPSSADSHKKTLHGCVQQAKLWLSRSDQPIHPGASLTYAELREKLNKIMASDYFTTTPEIKAPTDMMAQVVEKYTAGIQVQVNESTTEPPPDVQVDDDDDDDGSTMFNNEEQVDLLAPELDPDHFIPVNEPPQDEDYVAKDSGDVTSPEPEQHKLEADAEGQQNRREHELREQQNFPRRGYINPRGGGRRSYPNGGRGGGRGGRGGGNFQNARNQYYEAGYYPRSYYNNVRGRGGRSRGSSMYNNHYGAVAEAGGVSASAE